MTLQLSHIFFTDALTFIVALPYRNTTLCWENVMNDKRLF